MTDNIRDQEGAYQRGIVLGLTLAEIMLLVLFALLLVLTASMITRDEKIENLSHKLADTQRSLEIAKSKATGVDTETIRLAELIREWWEARKIVVTEVRPYFRELTRRIDEVDNLKNELEKLTEKLAAAQKTSETEALKQIAEVKNLKDKLEQLTEKLTTVEKAPETKALETIKDALQKTVIAKGKDLGKTDSLANTAVAAIKQNASLTGRVEHLSKAVSRMAKEGKGGTLPSCLIRDDGREDYLLDVVLASEGIAGSNRKIVAFVPDEIRKLFAEKDFSRQILSSSEFTRATRVLFRWSEKKNCRFYVKIYDGTGPSEKLKYKQHLRTVEGHFYKYEVLNDPPPFKPVDTAKSSG